MEVKVGQVYAINYSGSEAVVIAVDSESACVNRIGKYPDSGLQIFPLEEFKKFKLIRGIELREVSNKKKPSDLEIVQKALDKSGSRLSIASGGEWIAEKDIDTVTGSGYDTESLLTWAKQQIGVES